MPRLTTIAVILLALTSTALCACAASDAPNNKGVGKGLFGGEGLFDTVLTGPGKVCLQTMTVASLAKLIIPFIPKK